MSSFSNVTTIQETRVLELLTKAVEPIVAADIAAKLRIGGCRESQRRHVRGIVRKLRDEGNHIVATLQGGYWLTEDETIWKDYLDGRQIDAKRLLAETSRAKKAIDANGQGLLFMPEIQPASAMGRS